ncbi:MAG: ParB/RepB/Spo0J family partition protein [Candidatus Pacebacteria bacterium]|nr:ParB/RepB/Spo0J family partition protein [Candidatus Paceibacterota bacterium]
MKKFYSVLRVAGNSRMGGNPDTEADKAFDFLGFSSEQLNGHAYKASRPKVGERFVVEANMNTKTAGTFVLFRFMDERWEEILGGRITTTKQDDAATTNTFSCIGGQFSRLTIITPNEPIATHFQDLPTGTLVSAVNKEEGVITLNSQGEEVVGEEKVVFLDVSDIRRFEGQPRIFFNSEKLRALGDSIKGIGQLKAISVWRLPADEIGEDGCHFELDDGERRWLVHQHVGLKKIKAIIKTGKRKNLLERFTLSFVANLHAEPHTTYEIAKAILWIYEQVKDPAEIHRKTGLSIPLIYSYLRLKSLSPALLEQMSPEVPENNRLRLEHAKTLAGIKDLDEQQRIYDEAYGHSEKGIKTVSRTIKVLVAKSEAELNFVPRKRSPRKAATRAVQNLLNSLVELDTNETGLKHHLLFTTEMGRREVEEALQRAVIIIPRLLKVAKNMAS